WALATAPTVLSAAANLDGDRRTAVVDRLRQHSQLAVGARRGARPRDRRALGPGGEPDPLDPPTADRELTACRAGRRSQPALCGLGAQSAVDIHTARQNAACARECPRPARARFHGGACVGRRRLVWLSPGLAGHASAYRPR